MLKCGRRRRSREPGDPHQGQPAGRRVLRRRQHVPVAGRSTRTLRAVRGRRRSTTCRPTYQLDPQHRVTPIDHGDVCVNYDKAWFAPRRSAAAPQSLDDLTKPAYKDLLVVENPATSSPGLAFLLATIAKYGDDGWQDYWQQAARQRREGRRRLGAGVRRPTSPRAAAGRPPARRVVRDRARRPRSCYADAASRRRRRSASMLGTCFRQIEFAGVLHGTEEPGAAREAAHRLHAVATQFQDDMPLQMYVYPVATARRCRRCSRSSRPAARPAARSPPDEIGAQPRRVDRRVDAASSAVTGACTRRLVAACRARAAVPLAFLGVFFVLAGGGDHRSRRWHRRALDLDPSASRHRRRAAPRRVVHALAGGAVDRAHARWSAFPAAYVVARYEFPGRRLLRALRDRAVRAADRRGRRPRSSRCSARRRARVPRLRRRRRADPARARVLQRRRRRAHRGRVSGRTSTRRRRTRRGCSARRGGGRSAR